MLQAVLKILCTTTDETPVGDLDTSATPPDASGSPKRQTELAPQRRTPHLWLTHHASEQHDRCAVVGRTFVCRRCLVTYPLALLVMALGLAGFNWPVSLDPVLLWLLPAPAILDFVAEHIVASLYSPLRQKILSGFAAIGFGRGLTRYLQHPGDQLFWTVAVTYSLVMATSAVGRYLYDRHVVSRLADEESDIWWEAFQADLATQPSDGT